MDTVQVKKIKRLTKRLILNVKEADQKYDKVWKIFVNNHPESTFYHLPQYLRALEEESNQKLLRLVCADENGIPQGILPLLSTAGMPFNLGGVLSGKRISSLPRTPVGGPLINNIESAKKLLQKAVELVQSSGEHRLQIKYDSPDLGGLTPELKPVKWRKCYIKQLPENVQDLRFGKSSTHAAIKRAVKKAEKFGLKIRQADKLDDLKNWYNLYLETMRFHVVPARSFQFFVSLWNSFSSEGKLKLLLAEYPGDSGPVLLAGTIFLYFKETATYAFNGSSRKDFSIRPNDLIIWTAIHDANENGYKYFDMGEAAEGNSGLVQFKKKWTDTETQLYHYYYPSLPGVNGKMIEHENSNSRLKHIWQFIPLPLTALLGERINKHL